MIPPFNDLGFLPAGIHLATIDEIDVRFGQNSEIRRTQVDSVRWMLNLAWQAGIERIVLNGSFATDIMEPNDVDCVLLLGPHFPHDAQAVESLEEGLPFLDIQLVAQAAFDLLVDQFFATDRSGQEKGVIEVIGWKS